MGFEILIRENSGRIHQEEGQFEMAKIEIAFENFTFENFSTWSGRP